MRTRTGNPHREAHDQQLRCHDWIAPGGTDPAEIPALIEAVVPKLKLFHRGDGEVNGYVNTSTRPDGSVYVCIALYDFECDDPDCPNGEGPIALRQAPALDAGQLEKLKATVGEHDTHKLGVDHEADIAALEALGFGRQWHVGDDGDECPGCHACADTVFRDLAGLKAEDHADVYAGLSNVRIPHDAEAVLASVRDARAADEALAAEEIAAGERAQAQADELRLALEQMAELARVEAETAERIEAERKSQRAELARAERENAALVQAEVKRQLADVARAEALTRDLEEREMAG